MFELTSSMQDNLGDNVLFAWRGFFRNPSTPSAKTERAFWIWSIRASEEVSKLTPGKKTILLNW